MTIIQDYLSLTSKYKEEYSENDSEAYKVILIDHVGLISGSGTKKERIDLTAEYLIYFRNKCIDARGKYPKNIWKRSCSITNGNCVQSNSSSRCLWRTNGLVCCWRRKCFRNFSNKQEKLGKQQTPLSVCRQPHGEAYFIGQPTTANFGLF